MRQRSVSGVWIYSQCLVFAVQDDELPQPQCIISIQLCVLWGFVAVSCRRQLLLERALGKADMSS